MEYNYVKKELGEKYSNLMGSHESDTTEWHDE